MKPKLFLYMLYILAIVIPLFSVAQKSEAPCCTIMSIDPGSNTVIGRDITSGLTFQFKAEATDLNSLHQGHTLSMSQQAGKITAINGVNRSYTILQPDGISPCCSIVSIEANPEAPCCSIITAQNNAGGSQFSFSVPKNVSSGLRTGQTVSFGPIDSYAFVQSTVSSLSGNNVATYSYPVSNSQQELNSTNNRNLNANPAGPCCSIVFINPSNNLVLVRNVATGRLLQFKANAIDINGMKDGDAVSINSQTQKITGISSLARNYSLQEPDPVAPCCGMMGAAASPLAPCCSVINTSADPVAPCCTMVTATVMGSGNQFSFSVPKNISSTMKLNQQLFFVNNEMQSVVNPEASGFVVVQLKVDALRGNNIAAYSYPINYDPQQMNNTNNKSLNAKPIGPCCSIVSVNSSNNTIIGRDNSTGLTFQFKAEGLDRNSLKEGDQVSMNQQAGRITAINGIGRTYTFLQPDGLTPCCSIVTINADPAAPCCNIVAAQNSAAGSQFSFSVPKNIGNTLRKGQPVSFGPIDSYAFVQSALNTLSGNAVAMYSYPVNNAGPSVTKNPEAPCCSIMAIDVASNTVIGRDITNGLTFQFKAGAMDLNNLKKDDPLTINQQAGKITAINGIIRNYTLLQPQGIAPCCGIVSIQADPEAPCCNIITAQNTAAGNSFSFSVPKNISGGLRTGQPVSFGPIDSYAFVQSASNALSGNNAVVYSYPVSAGQSISGSDNNLDTSAGKKFEMKANPALKGATGKVLLNLPPDVECFIYIYPHGSEQQVAGTSRDRVFYLMPGSYDIKVSSALLEEITVKKGMDTRIRAGVLNIVSPSAWALYDEKKEVRITGASKAEKIGLPVGHYQLQMNGTFILVVIKDGESVDF